VDTEQMIETLRGVQLFSHLSDQELGKLAGSMKQVEFEGGRTIAREGESGVGFHLITSGKAEVTKGGASLGSLGPGNHFGEISLIDGGQRSATVTTAEPTTTLSLASWDFNRLVGDSPSTQRELMLGLCRIIRSMQQGG
jgi:CRP/FNR family cyclic AMP-dependent transcriptional regulator